MKAFAQSMAENYFWVWDEAFKPESLKAFLAFAHDQFEKGQFRPAQVGKKNRQKKASAVRNDQIMWLDQPFPEELRGVYDLLKGVQEASRRELFLPIKRFESHLAYYEPKAFYKRHIDRHQVQPSRILSSVLYLADWKVGDGGELVVYNQDLRPIVIQPQAGRFVVFDSMMEHEVKPTRSHRWSLTTWFRDDLRGGIKVLE